MDSVEVLTVKPAYFLGFWHHICIGVWRAQATGPAVEEIGQHYKSLRLRQPEGFGVIFIIEEHCPLPDDMARRKITKAVGDVSSSILAMVGVQEGSGFRGAAIRGALTAVNLMDHSPYPRKIVGTVADGAIWMTPIVARGTKELFRAGELTNAINDFRTSVSKPAVAVKTRL